jgi:hypothetical protein
VIRRSCGEPEDIPDNDHLLRRFMDSKNHLEWDADNMRWLPSAAAMQFDPDLSTSWKEHLEFHGMGPEAVIAGNDRYSLVGEWPVKTLRDSRLVITHSPSSSGPIDCAHTSVDWPPDAIEPGKRRPNGAMRMSVRNSLSVSISWVYGNITIVPPEGA